MYDHLYSFSFRFLEAHNNSRSHLTPCLLGMKQGSHPSHGALHPQDIRETHYFRHLLTPLLSSGPLSRSNQEQMEVHPPSGLTSSALVMSAGSASVDLSVVCGWLMVQKRLLGAGPVVAGDGDVRKRTKESQRMRSGRKSVRSPVTQVQ